MAIIQHLQYMVLLSCHVMMKTTNAKSEYISFVQFVEPFEAVWAEVQHVDI